MKRATNLGLGVVSVGVIAFSSVGAWAAGGTKAKAKAQPGLAGGFIENKGQWDPRALFFAKGNSVDTWVTKNGVVYDFYRETAPPQERPSKMSVDKLPKRSGHVVEMQFQGTEPSTRGMGVSDQHRATNFIGSSGGGVKAQSYEEARLLNLYNGVDLRVYRQGNAPRFDLLAAPHADITKINFKYAGANSVRQAGNGSLIIGTSLGDQEITDLHAYQQVNGASEPVKADFKLNNDGTVGFNIGSHNSNLPLVIDPVVYSTLLGAPFGTSECLGVTVDRFGDAVETGLTVNPNFPTTLGAYDRIVGFESVFVTKFTPDATNVIYSTVINSGVNSAALGAFVALDPQGRAVVQGVATAGMPVTANAYDQKFTSKVDPLLAPAQNMFVAILSADGAQLDYCTYLGGTGSEFAGGLTVDSQGNVYSAGTSWSPDYPLTSNAFQKNTTAFYPTFANGGTFNDNSVITVLNTSGGATFSSYFGGSGFDGIDWAAMDANNNLYVTGFVVGTDFPVTANAFDKNPDNEDAFVTKFGPIKPNVAVNLAYSTLLGGSGSDLGISIAVDNQDDAYILGQTDSVDFPTTAGAFGRGSNGGTFVTKMSVDGSLLLYSTFTQNGGPPFAIAVDNLGFAYITGSINFTNASMVLTANADQTVYAGPNNPLDPFGDVYLEVLNDSGTGEVFGTIWGGSEDDVGTAVAVDPSRSAYVAGWTNSYSQGTQSFEFPTTPGAFITDHFGPEILNPPSDFPEGFLMKFKVVSEPILKAVTVTPSLVSGTQTGTGTVTLTSPAINGGGAAIQLATSNPNFATLADATGNPLPGNVLLIPPGQSTGSFEVLTSDTVNSVTVEITAQFDGVQKVSTITISPWLQALTVSPFTVIGGNLVTGQLLLTTPAPSGGMTVNLQSSDPSKAFAVNLATGQPITSVVIPAGQTATSFNIETNGVDYPASVTFTARSVIPALSAVRTAQLTVEPAHLQVITFAPPVVNGGTPSVGTVFLNGKCGPTPIFLNLTKTAGGAPITLPNPPTLKISTGQSQAAFTVGTGAVPVNDFATVTATRTTNGETAKGTLFVDQIAIQAVSLSNTSVLGGATLTGNVVLTTPAAPGGLTVNVSSTSPTYAKLSTAVVTVPAGSIVSNNFTITTPVSDADHTVTITASKPGYVSKSALLLVNHLSAVMSVDQTSIIGGIQNVTGQLGINLPAFPPGVTFQVTSSNPAALHFAGSTVTIATGKLNTQPTGIPITSSVVSATQTVTLTASINAVPNPISVSKVVTVKPLSLTVTLNPTVVTGGLNSSKGTITLSAVAASNVPVTLSSSDPTAAFPAPSSVTILKGSSSATFQADTFPVAADEVVTIKATVNGGGFNTATLTVLAPRVQSLTIASPIITGGLATSGTVTMNVHSPAAGLNVPLSSSNTAIAQVPATVNIPSTAASGTFTINTTAVAADQTATITATYPSGHSVTATITVQATRSGNLTISPNDVVGGTSTTGTVSINVAAPPGGLPVTLMLDPNASGTPYVSIPSVVTIPAGTKSTTFTIKTSPVSRTVGTTITATFGSNGTTSSATLTLEPGG